MKLSLAELMTGKLVVSLPTEKDVVHASEMDNSAANRARLALASGLVSDPSDKDAVAIAAASHQAAVKSLPPGLGRVVRAELRVALATNESIDAANWATWIVQNARTVKPYVPSALLPSAFRRNAKGEIVLSSDGRKALKDADDVATTAKGLLALYRETANALAAKAKAKAKETKAKEEAKETVAT